MEIKQKIYRMVRGQKNPVGIIVSVPDHENKVVHVGFSLCMNADTFNKELALEIAYGRADTRVQLLVPPSIEKDMDKFVDRIARYYKGYTLGTDILTHSKFKVGNFVEKE